MPKRIQFWIPVNIFDFNNGENIVILTIKYSLTVWKLKWIHFPFRKKKFDFFSTVKKKFNGLEINVK